MCGDHTVPIFSRRRYSRFWRSSREVVSNLPCPVSKCRIPAPRAFRHQYVPTSRQCHYPRPAGPAPGLWSPTPTTVGLHSNLPNPGSADIPAAGESGKAGAAPHAHRPGQCLQQWLDPRRSPHAPAPGHPVARLHQSPLPSQQRTPKPLPFHPVSPSIPWAHQPCAFTSHPAPTPVLATRATPTASAATNDTGCSSPRLPTHWPQHNSTPMPPVSPLSRWFF